MAVQSFNRRFPLSLGRNVLVVPEQFGSLTAALAAASSGDVVCLLPGDYAGSLTSALMVPAGVHLIGYGPEVTTITMPSGTPTVPTVRFLGDNYCGGVGVYSQTSQSGTEGGVMLCGKNHTFRNCIFDGNQDNIAWGASDEIGAALITTMTTSGTTLSKTGAFASYTWRDGDKAIITAGGTVGIYDIASKTSSDAVVLGSAPGDSAGGVSAFICSQHSHWWGGLRMIDCRTTDWNFDYFKFNNTAKVGQLDMEVYGCQFGGAQMNAWIIVPPYTVRVENCVFDGRRASAGLCLSGQGGIVYRTVQSDAATPTKLSITDATWTQTGNNLAKTGAFATYTFRPGDYVLYNGVRYPVLSRNSDDDITLVTSMGGDATVTVTVEPEYRQIFKNCRIITSNPASTNSLFRVAGALNAARAGTEVIVEDCYIDAPDGVYLAKGASHASVSPKSSVTFINCRLPEGYTPNTTTLPNMNATSCPTIALRGVSSQTTNKINADGATITIDPNLGETQVTTGIAGDRSLAASAVSGSYHTGQRVTCIFASDGTGRTVTPDGSTIKGEAISVSATSTLRTMVSYRYTGSYWAQDGSPAVSGGVTDIGY